MSQVWLLPILVFAVVLALSVPIGLYMAKVFDGRLRLPAWLRWIESQFDTGPQSWKQYAFAFMAFNVVAFIVGFVVLALQPYLPLNPDGKKMLAPTTIFHTAISFLTNTNQQHYSGEVHFSYFSADLFHLLETGPLADHRHGRAGRHYPRTAGRQAHGQLLSRHVAGHGLRISSAVRGCGRRVDGYRRADDP